MHRFTGKAYDSGMLATRRVCPLANAGRRPLLKGDHGDDTRLQNKSQAARFRLLARPGQETITPSDIYVDRWSYVVTACQQAASGIFTHPSGPPDTSCGLTVRDGFIMMAVDFGKADSLPERYASVQALALNTIKTAARQCGIIRSMA